MNRAMVDIHAAVRKYRSMMHQCRACGAIYEGDEHPINECRSAPGWSFVCEWSCLSQYRLIHPPSDQVPCIHAPSPEDYPEMMIQALIRENVRVESRRRFVTPYRARQIEAEVRAEYKRVAEWSQVPYNYRLPDEPEAEFEEARGFWSWPKEPIPTKPQPSAGIVATKSEYCLCPCNCSRPMGAAEEGTICWPCWSQTSKYGKCERGPTPFARTESDCCHAGTIAPGTVIDGHECCGVGSEGK